jgi:hypothetical protein
MIKVIHKQPVPSHGLVREFSQEVHGDNFKEIAEEYANRNSDNVVEYIDSDEVIIPENKIEENPKEEEPEGKIEGGLATLEEIEEELPTEEDDEVSEENKEGKHFCDFCDSKGGVHKRNCTRPQE